MENYRDAFESSLKENPYDSSTRLIFADWLDENNFPDEAAEQRRRATPEWIEACKWMHNFAAHCGETCLNYYLGGVEEEEMVWAPITFEDCIRAGHEYVEGGDYFIQVGSQEARDLLFDEQESFWKNWRTITGFPLEDDKISDLYGPFSCSC